MNRRIICKILEQKHEDFLKSIDDDEVRSAINKHSIITGGSIVSLLLNEPVKDYDYYFDDKDTVLLVAKYYVKKFNELHKDKTYLTTTTLHEPQVQDLGERVRIVVPSAGIASENKTDPYQYFEAQPDEQAQNFVEQATSVADETSATGIDKIKEETKLKYRPVFMSSNAITLSDKVQLVIRFFGNAEEIHKNYDFAHCTNYWLSSDKKLYLNLNALESILSKTLQYQGSLYPLCSVIRTRKFLKNGWSINAGQYLKMCFQISELNLKDITVLEEQLTGVDAAYFHQVIDYCKQRQEEDKEFKVTAPYLVSIVDKIFG